MKMTIRKRVGPIKRPMILYFLSLSKTKSMTRTKLINKIQYYLNLNIPKTEIMIKTLYCRDLSTLKTWIRIKIMIKTIYFQSLIKKKTRQTIET